MRVGGKTLSNGSESRAVAHVVGWSVVALRFFHQGELRRNVIQILSMQGGTLQTCVRVSRGHMYVLSISSHIMHVSRNSRTPLALDRERRLVNDAGSGGRDMALKPCCSLSGGENAALGAGDTALLTFGESGDETFDLVFSSSPSMCRRCLSWSHLITTETQAGKFSGRTHRH